MIEPMKNYHLVDSCQNCMFKCDMTRWDEAFMLCDYGIKEPGYKMVEVEPNGKCDNWEKE